MCLERFTIWLRGNSLTTLTRFWPFRLPTYPGWHLRRNSFTITRENLYTVDISYATYLPRLVNIVCERPLSYHCPSTSSSSSYDVLAAHPDAGLSWAVHWGWRPPAAGGQRRPAKHGPNLRPSDSYDP